MNTKSELRSIRRGRPVGTFQEPAVRARAWHWLGEVLRIAAVDSARQLDQPSPRHPLARGLSVARRFESIQLDGYCPDRVGATPTRSLLTHLTEHAPGKSSYVGTRANYQHGFWKLLSERGSRNARQDKEIQRLLNLRGFARLGEPDLTHATILGLVSDEEASESFDQECLGDLPVDLSAVVSSPTLDGLQLVLLLYRESQDMARDPASKALRDLLRRCVDSFAAAHCYSGEQLDTWSYLTHTRMLRWDPEFEPGESSVQQATASLLKERKSLQNRPGVRGPASPDTYTRGRAERRWRRQTWIRACCLSFEQDHESAERSVPPQFFYTDSLLGKWLDENRDLIAQHRSRAEDLMFGPALFGDEGAEIPEQDPPSLTMPEDLYRYRERPRSSEQHRMIFGDEMPFDLIPVMPTRE